MNTNAPSCTQEDQYRQTLPTFHQDYVSGEELEAFMACFVIKAAEGSDLTFSLKDSS